LGTEFEDVPEEAPPVDVAPVELFPMDCEQAVAARKAELAARK
jgi:hypothetical protein